MNICMSKKNIELRLSLLRSLRGSKLKILILAMSHRSSWCDEENKRRRDDDKKYITCHSVASHKIIFMRKSPWRDDSKYFNEGERFFIFSAKRYTLHLLLMLMIRMWNSWKKCFSLLFFAYITRFIINIFLSLLLFSNLQKQTGDQLRWRWSWTVIDFRAW